MFAMLAMLGSVAAVIGLAHGLVAALTVAIREATTTGDRGAARVALDALNRLLSAPGALAAPIEDLAARRNREW